MRILHGLALVVLAASASSCLSDSADEFSFPAKDNPSPEGWVSSGSFIAPDFDVLWETAKNQACRGKYRIDDDATSYKSKHIITTWKLDLSTSRNDGKRRRRYVDFIPQKDVKNGWKVRVSTVRQRNVDLDQPLNPGNAEWRPDEPDVEDAEMVAWNIETSFRELGPSREFEMK